MFNVPLDEMTPEVRRQAKAINFGVIYGILASASHMNLRIPREEAQSFIDTISSGSRASNNTWLTPPHLPKSTCASRRSLAAAFIREINAKGLTAASKRAAINAYSRHVADIIRRAMVRCPMPSPDCPRRCCCRSTTNCSSR